MFLLKSLNQLGITVLKNNYNSKFISNIIIRGYYRNGYDEEELKDRYVLSDVIKGQILLLENSTKEIKEMADDASSLIINNSNLNKIQKTQLSQNIENIEIMTNQSIYQCRNEIISEDKLISDFEQAAVYLNQIKNEAQDIKYHINSKETNLKLILPKINKMQGWSQAIHGEINEILRRGIKDIINIREPSGDLKEEWKEIYHKSRQKKDNSIRKTCFYAQREAWLRKRGRHFDF